MEKYYLSGILPWINDYNKEELLYAWIWAWVKSSIIDKDKLILYYEQRY